jgi:hypothetical protein
MNGTETRGEEAVTLALSVAVTVISAIGLLLNAYILFVIIVTKQVYTLYCTQKGLTVIQTMDNERICLTQWRRVRCIYFLSVDDRYDLTTHINTLLMFYPPLLEVQR